MDLWALLRHGALTGWTEGSSAAKHAGMAPEKHIVERAIEVAHSGRCRSVAEIRKKLVSEGYTSHEIMGHLSGRAFVKQLSGLIDKGSNNPS